jgi:hypothetical protein
MNLPRRTAIVAAAIAVGTIALTAASCDDSTSGTSAQAKGEKLTEQAFKQQSEAVPYPVEKLTDSLERRNIRERLLRTNNPTRIQYVYLLGDTGTYLGYYAIKGKVSSTQSQMTADQTELDHGSHGQSVVSAPGDDGSYGANEAGIFFFTTEGVMVTTDLRYVVADAPLKVDAPKLNVPK